MTAPGGLVAGERRRSGWLRPGDTPQLSDHACASYLSDTQRAAAVSSWLVDGARIGQRAMYVGDGPVSELHNDLAAFPDLPAAIQSGAVVVASAFDLYALGEPIDAEAQLVLYDGAVGAALADGYTGLRVAADITPLVFDEELRTSHLQWEQFADRYMTQRPLAPLCLYDARRITALPAIAAAHPLQGPAEPPFTVFGCGPTAAAMEGEVDACIASVLADVLNALPATDRWLNVERVGFVDAHCAGVIHDVVRRRADTDRPLSVVGATKSFRKVWDLCRFDPELISA